MMVLSQVIAGVKYRGTDMEAQQKPTEGGQSFELIVKRLLTAPARRHDLATRTNRVLASVLQEWHEVGYVNAQIHRIANRAGMSTATLYRLFPDKNAINCDALKLGNDIMVGLLTKAQSHPNPIHRLTEIVFNHAETLRQDYVRELLLSQSLMLLEPDIQDRVRDIAREGQAGVKQFWQNNLQELVTQGLIRLDDIDWQECRLKGAVEARTLGRFFWGYPDYLPEISWRSDAQSIVEDFFKLYGTTKFHTMSLTYNWDWKTE
ncbi:TetR/AcrR family transcriptional regulator [Aquidulcibacter sp.]|uniref:TetR/AcrR family transcriptional regulator n=1 Tax=Aquidulcibacter sp. TaxID=2052990 RepID=UPI0025C3BC49|nr:TetR/AcrR family transcriptional regulator [Aquidulcibacter sp.]MCA3694700.1 TetR/AcrR family transcriptional regulator [Aquidulcibacter sp.]